MKIQIEQLAYLFVIRILGKKINRSRSYLLLDTRKWDDRKLTSNELWRMQFKILNYIPKGDDS